MLSIRTLNRVQLLAFVQDAAFGKLPFIPISRHRALSHIANPRVEENDVLLLTAYENEALVGYLGVLPDRMFRGDQSEKCGWLSCLWVSEEHRGKRIAQQLLEKCFDVWNRRILVTEFTGPAKALYDRSGIFHSLADPIGIRLYLRADLATLLPPKKDVFRKNQALLQSLDHGINTITDLRLPKPDLNSEAFTLEYPIEIDDETAIFIESRQHNQLFKRGKEELNWILNNPWILSAPEKDPLNSRYHFSSVEKQFNFSLVKVRGTQNELIAFLLFAQRNESLKLPYCYHNGNMNAVWKAIRHELLRLHISTFTTFQPDLVDYIHTHDKLAFFHKKVTRNYIISTRFDAFIGAAPIAIQDGDADCSFT
jgi:GNAT superfamily N-acetyltransferase